MNNWKNICKKTLIYITSILYFNTLLFTPHAESALFDRVVAFVDNDAITLSELKERVAEFRRIYPDMTQEEVLQSMINRLLLLREAKRYRLEAATEEETIKEYTELKIKAFIHVSEAEMDKFYVSHRERFGRKTYEEVHEEIETYFMEKELNERLKSSLAALRKQAYISVQIDPPGGRR